MDGVGVSLGSLLSTSGRVWKILKKPRDIHTSLQNNK